MKSFMLIVIVVMLFICQNVLWADYTVGNWYVQQLTDNDLWDRYPQISGSTVAWVGDDGNDTEVFVYDGTETWQLTENNGNDDCPYVSGSSVVWVGREGPGGFGSPHVYMATYIPEPTTLSLLLIGGLTVLKRRRLAARSLL